MLKNKIMLNILPTFPVRLKRRFNTIVSLTTFIIFICLGCGCNIGVPIKEYFIPYGFEGNVAVIYSTTDDPKGNLYSFIIPDSGILKTSFGFHEGQYVVNFYQKNAAGLYDTLYEEFPYMKMDTTKNRVLFSRILTFQKGNGQIYTVGTFYVGKKKLNETERERFHFENKLGKIVVGE